MKEHSYLTFSLNNYLYGISQVYVEEFFSLPELTTIAENPYKIVGLVNIRGNILPVMDFNFTLSSQPLNYRLTDSLVVLKWQEFRLGIIVNQIYEVINISPDKITPQFTYEQELVVIEQREIIAGVADIPANVFIFINPNNWFNYVEINQFLSSKNLLEPKIISNHNADIFPANSSELSLIQQPVFCPNATLEETTTFPKRADNLRLPPESQDLKTFITLAVFALNGNFFGINLEMVREFTDIRQVTPIPCVKPHIIGNMNLRGEILTLIDICGLLNLPLMGIANNSKAMVVEVEGIVAGLMVEQVCDVMFSLNPREIRAVTTAIHSVNDEYLQGTVLYHEKIMSILDLPKIFLNGGLIVDEVI
ncbi:chemotaxis protein CheW [Scytonema hofmannii FACHB-248]|uniref:Chemotaxis protein CheW n=1 Tax=Scytonema hofmannii FACHB-248 TaxID=1842502 RepID=A0ABR8GZH8_9CYAN|nr:MULTISPECIES: chemotaxis protein CheW [Nostocales]MBD2608421.1 chemotaxis protein CheW [Scytonema hofmannii FACHB-248]